MITGTVPVLPTRFLIELPADEPERARRFWEGLLETTLAERWLKLQVQVGPPPPAGGTATGPAGGRPPKTGPGGSSGGLVGGPTQPRRPAPMVARKGDADDLVGSTSGAAPSPVKRPELASVQTSPYAGVGRNDPCPCGSGKKFKKCHGANL